MIHYSTACYSRVKRLGLPLRRIKPLSNAAIHWGAISEYQNQLL